MAPVEIDHVPKIPKSIIAPVKEHEGDREGDVPPPGELCLHRGEVTRLTSPYMESTMTKVSPVMEMVSPMVEFVSPMVDSVKTRGEEQLMTHVPSGISETVQSVQVKAVDQVVAAFEKVNVDFNY